VVGALVVPVDDGGAADADADADIDVDVDVDVDALDAFCRQRLASHKVPRRWGIADALPRTASGTVEREAVRDRLA
jgi:O-succinylbenzoic acid--CoA ligase